MGRSLTKLSFATAVALSAAISQAAPQQLPWSSSAPNTAAATTAANDVPLTPNGKKAGSAGGRAVTHWQEHLGWWYDWSPKPEQRGDTVSVAMLWGVGDNSDIDRERFEEFQQLSEAPQYLLGFNEPDCGGSMSAGIEVERAVQVWNDMIVPWAERGSLLGSPSMCAQKDETWLQQFNQSDLARSWDFTAIHVYKPDMDGVREDIDHYWHNYGKPIWITEFACVYDQDGFEACSDQGEINSWIDQFVDLVQNDERVYAYGYTDGGGLNDMWLPTNQDGSQLAESGQTYLNAISKYN